MVKLVSSSMALFLALASVCMAQSTSASTKTAVTPPAPTGAPGGPAILIVYSPQNNTIVHQGQTLSLMTSFANRRAITSFTASVSKLDGSGNQTVATSIIPNMLRSVAEWNVTSDFPLGSYKINIQAMPLLTLPTIPGQAVPTPLAPMDPVYYWNGVINVQAALAPTAGGNGNGGGAGSTNGATHLSKIGGTATYMVLGAFLWL